MFKKMKKIIIIACMFLFLSLVPISQVNAESPSMKIHSLYLPKTVATRTWGSPVVLESKGEYLMIDSAHKQNADDIIKYLKKRNISKIDLLVSHYHPYAYACNENIMKDPYFDVNTIYLPDNSISADLPYNDKDYQDIRKNIKNYAINNDVNIEYIKVGDTIKNGDAIIKVIGPVGNYSFSYFLKKMGNTLDAQTRSQNNNSLVTMVTCGNKKFLTAGDMSSEEEIALMKKYGKSVLSADVYQLPHHGLGTSEDSFFNYVKPKYSFAANHIQTYRYSSGNRKTYKQRTWASKFGIYYMTADEKKDLIIDVTNTKITMYKGGTKLSGWVTLQGGKGRYRATDKYYVDPSTGKPYTGIRKVGGKYYNFGTGGCVEYANYNDNGTYKYWKDYDPRMRYYTKSGEMYVGFRKVGKKLYYFNSQGYRKLGKSNYKPVKIGSKKYLLSKKGVIYTKGWKKYSNGKKRYVTKKGVMVTGWKKIGKTKYYFSKKTGYMTKRK